MSNFVTAEELRDVTGIKQPAALERWLRENQVQYWIGREGPFTTPALLHASKGYAVDEQQRSKWEDA